MHIGRLILLGLLGGVASYIIVPGWHLFRKDIMIAEGESVVVRYLDYLKM